MKDIYIVFSSTPYKMGKFIRTFTRSEYNHVSIMFDENMKEAYSFGRKYIDTPFWGGIIKDSVSRYEYKNVKAYIDKCKITVDDETFEKVYETIKNMYLNKDLYIYNLFSAGISIFRKRVPIVDTYTCVEFCVYILGIIDKNMDTNCFYNVKSLHEKLKQYSIYEGVFDIIGEEDIEFKNNKGKRVAFKGLLNTVLELIRRMKKTAQ